MEVAQEFKSKKKRFEPLFMNWILQADQETKRATTKSEDHFQSFSALEKTAKSL